MRSNKLAMTANQAGADLHHSEKAILESSASHDPRPLPSIKVLVVEGASEVVDTIILSLSMRWPDIRLVATPSGSEAIQFAQNAAPDIVLLNLTLSDIYGLQVLRELHLLSNVPVIIITGNSAETVRLKSFEMGAADYLLKPFSHIELLGCVASVLNRTGIARGGPRAGSAPEANLVIDLVNLRVLQAGVENKLTGTEQKVLSLLIRNQGKVISFARLARQGWKKESMTRADLHASMRQLRMKLGDDAREPGLLQLQRNKGYVLSLFN